MPHLLEPAAESPLDTPSTGRLVIRIKLIPQQEPPAPRRSSRTTLLVLIGIVAVLLGWFGVRIFQSEPIPPPPARSAEPAPAPAESPVQVPPDAPTAAINEHLPDVPQSALDTIRGTVRVAVRVTVDKQGTVIDASAADRGPSRYFERLALDAAKQWTFTPTRSDEPRIMLVRFNFTRTEVTAQASPAQ